jgi:hypothetical protein
MAPEACNVVWRAAARALQAADAGDQGGCMVRLPRDNQPSPPRL